MEKEKHVAVLPQPGRAPSAWPLRPDGRGYAGGGPAYSFSLRDRFILSERSPGHCVPTKQHLERGRFSSAQQNLA